MKFLKTTILKNIGQRLLFNIALIFSKKILQLGKAIEAWKNAAPCIKFPVAVYNDPSEFQLCLSKVFLYVQYIQIM